eukprot:352972-Chlamydomonas_euryale.AAC.10
MYGAVCKCGCAVAETGCAQRKAAGLTSKLAAAVWSIPTDGATHFSNIRITNARNNREVLGRPRRPSLLAELTHTQPLPSRQPPSPLTPTQLCRAARPRRCCARPLARAQPLTGSLTRPPGGAGRLPRLTPAVARGSALAHSAFASPAAVGSLRRRRHRHRHSMPSGKQQQRGPPSMPRRRCAEGTPARSALLTFKLMLPLLVLGGVAQARATVVGAGLVLDFTCEHNPQLARPITPTPSRGGMAGKAQTALHAHPGACAKHFRVHAAPPKACPTTAKCVADRCSRSCHACTRSGTPHERP